MAVIYGPGISARAQILLGGNPYTNPSELPAQPPALPIYSPVPLSASKKAPLSPQSENVQFVRFRGKPSFTTLGKSGERTRIAAHNKTVPSGEKESSPA